jgi:hypothetical protein
MLLGSFAAPGSVAPIRSLIETITLEVADRNESEAAREPCVL